MKIGAIVFIIKVNSMHVFAKCNKVQKRTLKHKNKSIL